MVVHGRDWKSQRYYKSQRFSRSSKDQEPVQLDQYMSSVIQLTRFVSHLCLQIEFLITPIKPPILAHFDKIARIYTQGNSKWTPSQLKNQLTDN
jgi:hypothetical protein